MSAAAAAAAVVVGRRRFLTTILNLHYRSSALVPSVCLRANAAIQNRSSSSHIPSSFRVPKSSDVRWFSSGDRPRSQGTDAEPEGSEDDDAEEGEGDFYEEEEEGGEVTSGCLRRIGVSGKTEAEKVQEAAEIGYKVAGPLRPDEEPFKQYEPVFAVVQVGSHQFKVSNGDAIHTERLKFCDVNDKLILNKVLILGSKSQTIIGRPILPDAAVHAVVEEHALDAKVIIFKKKRRKNYRRTRGHRQELTKLRITNIEGIEKPEEVAVAA